MIDSSAQIQQRDAHLANHRRFTMASLIFLGVLSVLSLMANFVLVLAFQAYPKTTFLWTKDAKAVCEAIPLDKPNISQALLADFANRAAISVHTYDYFNWQQSMNYAVNEYFTPEGGREFLKTFAQSGILKQVRENNYVVSAVSDGQTVITATGVDHGRFFWTAEVPLTITYRKSPEYKAESRVIKTTIVRIDPSPENPNGVAVDGFVSVQRTARHE